MKCSVCNRPIARPLFWNGQAYGRECWKRVVLPEIERMKVEREQLRLVIAQTKAYAVYSVAKRVYDRFVQSVCDYYERKSYMSSRQIDAVYKKLTFQEKLEVARRAYEAGLHEIDVIAFLSLAMRAVRSGTKNKQAALAELEQLDGRIVELIRFLREHDFGYDVDELSDDEKEEVRAYWRVLAA